MTNRVLVHDVFEPLDGAKAAKIDIDCGIGHLVMSRLEGGVPMLISGTLQYLEKQGLPTRSVNTSDGQTALTLKAGDGKQSRFHFPWAGCGGACEWQIRLNPAVSSDVNVRSRGGRIKLDLTGMAITRLSAETGGGNLGIVMPDNMANLTAVAKTGGGNVNVEAGRGAAGTITARSGAGNVAVRVPNGVAAKIQADTGMGKVTIDPRFSKIDKNIYQSADYESAAIKLEIVAHSGAGNVSVT